MSIGSVYSPKSPVRAPVGERCDSRLVVMEGAVEIEGKSPHD
jgi:hypothetical protein